MVAAGGSSAGPSSGVGPGQSQSQGNRPPSTPADVSMGSVVVGMSGGSPGSGGGSGTVGQGSSAQNVDYHTVSLSRLLFVLPRARGLYTFIT